MNNNMLFYHGIVGVEEPAASSCETWQHILSLNKYIAHIPAESSVPESVHRAHSDSKFCDGIGTSPTLRQQVLRWNRYIANTRVASSVPECVHGT